MDQIKTHWKKLVNADYLAFCDLNGDLNVKIVSVGREMVKGQNGKQEECTVARLAGQKPFIVNRTNAKIISKLVKSPYIEDWTGKTITLFQTYTSVAGEQVECLRVRPTLPKEVDNTAAIQAEIDQLKTCKTIQELQACYKSLHFASDNKVIAEKDRMKAELQKPAQ